MKTHKLLNDKQIASLKRIRKEISSIYCSYEQFADKTSNISLLLRGILQALDSILSYMSAP